MCIADLVRHAHAGVICGRGLAYVRYSHAGVLQPALSAVMVAAVTTTPKHLAFATPRSDIANATTSRLSL